MKKEKKVSWLITKYSPTSYNKNKAQFDMPFWRVEPAPQYPATTVVHNEFWMIVDHRGTRRYKDQPPDKCSVDF